MPTTWLNQVVVGHSDTWHRLRDWSGGQAASERLAAHVLLGNGFTEIDPTHPRGGPDRKRDAEAKKDGNKWIMAVFFPPRGQRPFGEVIAKFQNDLKGVASNNATGIAFVTNQDLSDAERGSLRSLAKPHQAEIFHIERVRLFLDHPPNHALREQFLDITTANPATIEQISKLLDKFHQNQISDMRASEEEETLEHSRQVLYAQTDANEIQARLPGNISNLVANAMAANPKVAEIVEPLTTGRADVSEVLDLLDNPPSWLTSASDATWKALVECIDAYGSELESRAAFGIAARETTGNRRYWRARERVSSYWSELQEGQQATVDEQEETPESEHPLYIATWHLQRANPQSAIEILEGWQPSEAKDLDLKALLTANAHLSFDQPDYRRSVQVLEAREPATRSAGVLTALARVLSRRAYFRLGSTPDLDFERALRFAITARDFKRSWGGDSSAEVTAASEIAILRNDWPLAVKLTVAPPRGEATRQEASSASVMAKAAMAMASQGLIEEARALADQAGPFDRALLDATVAEVSLQQSQASDSESEAVLRAQWQSVWQAAGSDEQKLTAARGLLANNAILDAEQNSVLDANPHARAEGESMRDTARRADETLSMHKARLRGVARANKFAASRLADILESENEQTEAAAILEQAADDFHDQKLRLSAASILERADRYTEAAEVASRSLTRASGSWPGRSRALRFLHNAAHVAGNWAEAGDHARALLEFDATDSRATWWLAMAESNSGNPEAAWAALNANGQPPVATSFGEEIFLLRLSARFASRNTLWTYAVRLARSYVDDEEKIALVLQIAFAGAAFDSSRVEFDKDCDVTDDSSSEPLVELQELAENFFEKFPASTTGLRRITIDPNDPLGSINETLAEGAAARAEKIRELRRPEWPIGAVVPVSNKRYAEILLEPVNPTWMLRSDSTDDQLEDGAAVTSAVAEGIDVIVDMSMIRTFSLLREPHTLDLGPVSQLANVPETVLQRLLGMFAQTIVSDDVVQDVLSARDSYQISSGLSLSYDQQTGRLYPQTQSEARIQTLRSRSQALLDETRRHHIRSAVHSDERAADRDFSAWLGTVEFARATGRPLWCDDAPLRRIARQLGVPSFGTAEVYEYAYAASLITPSERASLRQSLLLNGASDLVVSAEELRLIAASENWSPGSAATHLAYPGCWSRMSADCVDLLGDAIDSNTDDYTSIAVWAHQAAFGLFHTTPQPDSRATAIAASIARIFIRPAITSFNLAAVLSGFAEAVTSEALLPIWRRTLERVHQVFLNAHGEAGANQLLLGLVSQCSDDFRMEALRVILGPRD